MLSILNDFALDFIFALDFTPNFALDFRLDSALDFKLNFVDFV